MHKKTLLLLSVLFIIFFAPALKAQDKGIATPESFIPTINYPYLQKLIDTAKKYYPEVRIKATQTEIATTSYHQSQTSWFDIITPSYLYNPSKSSNLVTPTAFNSYQLAISVNIGNIIAKPFLIKNARQAVKIAQLQQVEYNYTIEAQVKRLYFAYIAALANLKILDKGVQDALSNSTQLKHKYENGETTLAEYAAGLQQFYGQNSIKVTGELAVFTTKTNLEEFVGKRLEEIK